MICLSPVSLSDHSFSTTKNLLPATRSLFMSIRMDPAVEEGFRLPDEGGGVFRVGRVEEGGDVAAGDEKEVAGAICSKPNSEH